MLPMRFVLLPLLLTAFSAGAAESPWPEKLPENRYDAMKEQSPFALATAPAEPPKAPTESFTANWELTGAGTLPDGREYVAVRSRDRRVAFSLAGGEVSTDPDAQGVSLASVNWSPGYRKTSATLKKGTEFAKVEYSAEAAPPQQPPGNPMNPGGIQRNAAAMPGVLPGAYGSAQSNVNQVGGVNRLPGGVRTNVNANGLVIPNGQGGLPASNVIQAPNQNGAPQTRKLRVINTR
jgi:hypothetical protein